MYTQTIREQYQSAILHCAPFVINELNGNRTTYHVDSMSGLIVGKTVENPLCIGRAYFLKDGE